MSRPLLGAASRLVARVSASRFAKPGARVAPDRTAGPEYTNLQNH